MIRNQTLLVTFAQMTRVIVNRDSSAILYIPIPLLIEKHDYDKKKSNIALRQMAWNSLDTRTNFLCFTGLVLSPKETRFILSTQYYTVMRAFLLGALWVPHFYRATLFNWAQLFITQMVVCGYSGFISCSFVSSGPEFKSTTSRQPTVPSFQLVALGYPPFGFYFMTIVFLRSNLEYSYFSADMTLKYSCDYSEIIKSTLTFSPW